MTQAEIINKILLHLSSHSVRVPIAFSEEESFRIRLGISNPTEFSHACHHMESLGLVNYVHTHGLQITGKGVEFIAQIRANTVTEKKTEFAFEPIVSKYIPPKPKPKKVSLLDKLKKLLTPNS